VSLYLAAYDISDDRDRLRVARILDRFGPRLQDSVFEIRLERIQVDRLLEEIGALLAPDDAFDLVPIDERRPASRLRWQRPPPDWSPVITGGRAFGWRR
jgi:CRISPR-associated endonuclease Cas2